MKIEKNLLNGTLWVLGKVTCLTSLVEEYRSIRFCGVGDVVKISVVNGCDWVTLKLPCEEEGEFDFGIEIKTLREMIRQVRSKWPASCLTGRKRRSFRMMRLRSSCRRISTGCWLWRLRW